MRSSLKDQLLKEKKREELQQNIPKKPWPSPVALSYLYPWECAEATDFIFTGWR